MFKRVSLRNCLVFGSTTFLLLIALVGYGNAEIVLRLGHDNQLISPTHVTAAKWAQLISERAGGKVTIKIYPQGQLGGEKSLVEQLRLGTVDATIVAHNVIVGFVPEFQAITLPFAFKDYDHAYKFLNGAGGTALLNKLETIGIKGMGFINTGFRSIGNNIRPLYKPEDLKGIKIREIPDPLALAAVSAMGANAVPIPWGEVISALEQKTIDGVSTGNSYYWSARLYDYTKYFSYTNHLYTSNVVLMSLQSFNRLPKDLQEIVAKTAIDSLPDGWKSVADTEANLTKNLEGKGIKVNTVDPKPFKEKVEHLWKEYEPKIGKELVDEVKKAIAK
ncbi:MAG: hypothetical protein A2W09_02920 [Deltaproteobacteria bacterium RBG_16_50_11]|nr:MAG: hypothetical protein A2W09_02920 [Deltaproteobacteria bacterium RBG_16_50_11]